MSGVQWRKHAVVSQAVAHAPLLGQKVMELVSRPQHGLDELSAERLMTLTHCAQSRCHQHLSLWQFWKEDLQGPSLNGLQLVWLLFHQCCVPCWAGILDERPHGHHCREHPEHTVRWHPCVPEQSQEVQPLSCLAVYHVHMLAPSLVLNKHVILTDSLDYWQKFTRNIGNHYFLPKKSNMVLVHHACHGLSIMSQQLEFEHIALGFGSRYFLSYKSGRLFE